ACHLPPSVPRSNMDTACDTYALCPPVLFWRLCFFFTDTATTEIYTLSLHDALPISPLVNASAASPASRSSARANRCTIVVTPHRSEEHTSELQSRGHLVCRLLLEKKKQTTTQDKKREV